MSEITVNVAEDETVRVTVTESGPAGPTGPTGATGATGPEGPQGDPADESNIAAAVDAHDADTASHTDKVSVTGDTMTGPLTLAGNASSALHATPLQQVQALLADLVDSSPAALDTLAELAAALADDPNFATTITNALAAKETPAGAQAKVDALAGELALCAAPTGVAATDTAAVAAAIAALPSTGGTVLLRRGTYVGRFAVDKNNVVLRGMGQGATVLKLTSGLTTGAQTLTITADRVTVRDLTVDGNKAAQTIPVDEIRQADGIGIYADHVTIENVHVKDAAGHGIIVWNEATATHDTCPNASKAAGARRYCQIRHNVVENNGHTSDSRSAIDIATSNTNVDNVIAHNLVIMGADTSSGITMHGGARTVIAGNIIVCTDRERAVMVHTGSYACRVVNNIIVKAAGSSGVVVGIATDALTDTLVADNYFESDRNGARFFAITGTVTNIDIHDNRVKFSASATATRTLIYLDATAAISGIVVHNNDVTNYDKLVHDSAGSAEKETRILLRDGLGLPPLRTGIYLSSPCTVSTGTYSNGVLYASPLWLATPRVLDRLAMEVTVVGAAGALYRLGLYSDDGVGRPNKLLADGGTVAADVGTGAKEVTINVTLGAGLYWMVAVLQGAPASAPTVRQNNGVVDGVAASVALDAAQGNVSGYNLGSGITGALPATAPAISSTSSRVPRVVARTGAAV